MRTLQRLSRARFPRVRACVRHASFALALVALALPAFAADLAVTLPDGHTLIVDSALLEPLPRIAADATAHGKTARYEGYDLRAVLAAAGLPPVDALRGKALAQIVRAHAADGYEVAFALAELDPSLGNRQVLLVDTQDGAPLPAADGPWRLVFPSDARPARWIRQLDAIDVLPRAGTGNAHSTSQNAGGQECQGTTTDMMACLGEHERAVDAALAKYLFAAQTRIDDSFEAKPDLSRTQAAWVAYRQAQCDDIDTFWRNGTIHAPASAMCYLEITRRRIHEIWSEYLAFPDSTPPLLPEPSLRE